MQFKSNTKLEYMKITHEVELVYCNTTEITVVEIDAICEEYKRQLIELRDKQDKAMAENRKKTGVKPKNKKNLH